jgi:hypothetical protein
MFAYKTGKSKLQTSSLPLKQLNKKPEQKKKEDESKEDAHGSVRQNTEIMQLLMGLVIVFSTRSSPSQLLGTCLSLSCVLPP